LAFLCVFALQYGTAIEVSVALALTRADVWEASKEIRAAGTKAHKGSGESGGGLGLGDRLGALPAGVPVVEPVDRERLAARDGGL
jgi:hypothetical protein